MNKIVIAEDFSDAPGARYRSDGPKSGQEFFEDALKPKFATSLSKNEKLLIDFDGTWGYATSFISEAFGRLSREFGAAACLASLEFKSDEDPKLISYTLKIINEPAEK